MRLAQDRFLLVTGSQFGVRDSAWIRRHLPEDGSPSIRDVTSAYAVLNLVGPRSRDILQATTDDDLSSAAFPYLAVRPIEVGLATVRAHASDMWRAWLGIAHPSEHTRMCMSGCWRQARPSVWSTPATGPSSRCAWRKASSTGRAEVTPDTNPYEADWALPSC
jgi:4-methylaminobutanoate oxidase (formaldehyde-forming)